MAWQQSAVIHWLFHEGRLTADPRVFVENLGRRLVEAGAPLWRLRIGCRTIHPQIAAWSLVWATDTPQVTDRVAGHGFKDNDTYIGGPMQHVVETETPFRRRLENLDEDRDHRLLFELAADGATDYLALPLIFSDRTVGTMIVASQSEAGFDDADVAAFEGLVPYVAPIFEVLAARKLARTLLDTYVGPRTGERVLSGQIKRGDGEIIHAAIWFSDLRDFTPLTESLEPQDLLAMLNAYFEAVAAAVTARGGEILRFIGDAMLIVFPVGSDGSQEDACTAAVEAARDAINALAALNMRRKRSGQPEIRFGVGLHLGEVIYGNVGAPDRLDFTVMGPAVNRTARLEGLTKTLGHGLILSDEFAARLDEETESLGFHPLKGVADEQEVFALGALQ